LAVAVLAALIYQPAMLGKYAECMILGMSDTVREARAPLPRTFTPFHGDLL